MIQYLIRKFNAKSKVHLLVIFFVFGVSGSFSLWISSPIMSALDLKSILNSYPLYIFFRSKANMMGDEIQSEKEPLKPNIKKITNK